MATTPADELKGFDTSKLETEDDDSAPAVVPETGGGESKVKVILGLLKKLIGVSDVANLRLSLPASLLEPIPNLEYWHYADRPDIFASMGDSPDELERMLSVMRYSFSNQLKFVRYKIGKPYNSTLGEHFQCNWSLSPVTFDPKTKAPVINAYKFDPSTNGGERELVAMSAMSTPMVAAVETGDDVSVRSLGSPSQTASGNAGSKILPTPSKLKLGRAFSARSSTEIAAVKDMEKAVAGMTIRDKDEKVEVVYLTEQVSHHPPISSAYYCCPQRGVEMSCVDQISAKVSFPCVQITPGSANQGLFIKLSDPSPGAGETYQITHPIAQVNGIMRGQYYGTISDKTVITCTSDKPGLRLKAITEYKDESWLGKPKFALEGIVFQYDPSKADEVAWSKIKSVPSDRILGNYEGSWRKQIKWRRKGEKEWRIIIDMDELDLVPKDVRPLEEQTERESRNLWREVTGHIVGKNWGEATREKQIIEQAQRDRSHEMKQQGRTHIPTYFEQDISSGQPKLSEQGRQTIQQELARARRHAA
ncbi:hypothetical protein FFLO_05687 [Filobasidium floriforme]|uniref:Oxysterol-binding protein n=1 Tax=Filobasidium floriforme TaxID=5210 RepID=A0A8K0NNR4_9TREE|nr:uncharacterized protein HD553DRAFT_304694 [Filobasidium floriforme]KAG7529415.1 hypothetical protein FFLO_05687 [Filobasidium floriforme]KAH8089746.1 hypothetical protein HD553DRAFT_304694 [Filobasidium floriforme]